MQDIYSWSANHPKWAGLGKVLAESRSKLNGQTGSAFEAFVEAQPEAQRQQWHEFLGEYAAYQAKASSDPSQSTARAAAAAGTGSDQNAAKPAFSLARDDKDPIGRTVRRVHVDTDEFVIYCADDAQDPDDVCSLSYAFKPAVPNDKAKAMRAGLCPVAAQIARLADAVCSLRPVWGDTSRHRRERERAFELMARAMAFGLEGQKDQAKAILDELEAEITLRRDSQNRMRYIFATTLSFVVVAVVGMGLKHAGMTWFGDKIGAAGHETLILDVLLFGALGAFFAVVYDIKSVKVHHAITSPEMIYAGAVRIPVGVIAAAVVILLISGKWMLGGLDDAPTSWSLLLLGFLAGFSEMFVPNALKDVESHATVAKPGQAAPA